MVGPLGALGIITKTSQQLVVGIEKADAAGEFGNDHTPVLCDGNATRLAEGDTKDLQEVAFQIEGLDPTILAIGNEQSRLLATKVDGEAMGCAELALLFTGAPETEQVIAVRVEAMDKAFAITIRDEHASIRGASYRCREVLFGLLVKPGCLWIVKGGEDLALEIRLQHLMPTGVCQIEVLPAFLFHQGEAMQAAAEVLSPGIELPTILVEDDHGWRRLTAGENTAFAVHCHPPMGDSEICAPGLLVPSLIPNEGSRFGSHSRPMARVILGRTAAGEGQEAKEGDAHVHSLRRPAVVGRAGVGLHLVKVWVMQRDLWFGFLMPLPIFVQVFGRSGLYAEPWDAPQGLGVPVGFLAAAALLLPDLPRMTRPLPFARLPRLAIGVLCLWVFGLGVWSSRIDPISLLHALQWIAPVCLVSYAAVVAQESPRLEALLRGLTRGTACALAFLLILAGAELLHHGLPDGRIRQNLFLPGMYQLYNYVPVGLTTAGLFCAGYAALGAKGFSDDSGGGRSPMTPWLWLAATASLPLLTGARDPALMFLLVAPFPAWWAARGRGLVILASGCLGLTLALLWAADGNLLLLHKFQAMFFGEGDLSLRGLAGNRATIVEQYWGLVQSHPITGTGLLPPWIADSEAGVTAKGAHNYYLDTLAWAGPLALGSVLVLVVATLKEIPQLLLGNPSGEPLRRIAMAAAGPVAAVLLVSSNLRTPLREPIAAMVAYLLLGLTLTWAYRSRRV